jgi:D-apionolactonase
MPPAVDPRQMSLAGAAWTVAMLAALAPSGVESLTFYETSGWRGVMETARGSMLPDQFPSFPSDVFPVWHVFAALSGFRSVAAGQVSHPERISALGLSDRSGRSRVILSNLTPESVEVCLDLPGATVRLLDEQSVAGAMREPESWWKQEPQIVSTLRLTAHAIAFIDLA